MSKRVANSRANGHNGRYARQIAHWSERYRRALYLEGQKALSRKTNTSPAFRELAVKQATPDAPKRGQIRRGLRTTRRGG